MRGCLFVGRGARAGRTRPGSSGGAPLGLRQRLPTAGPREGGHPHKLVTTAVDKPNEVGRRALFPVVGEKTLRELVAEAKANEKVFKAKVRTTLRSSYSSYYRQMLPPLLNTLGFRCNNTAYRPVMDAMKLLKK